MTTVRGCSDCPLADPDRAACRHPYADGVVPFGWPRTGAPVTCPLRDHPLHLFLAKPPNEEGA